MTLDGVWNYVYDAENRLVQMTTTSSAVTAGFPNRTLEFKYDYLGRRVQKRSENVTAGTDVYSRYLYDGNNLIAEFNATSTTIGSLLRSYTWGLDLAGSLTATGGVGALVQITDHATSTSYFPTFDGNGNVASLLNASSGAVVAAYEYSPFGELLRCAGSYATSNPFRFSTKFTDDESGLVYYGHRYYSPGLGRFINRDPIEEAGGLNLYGFCGNDGINGLDVLGNSWLSKLWHSASRLWDRTGLSLGMHIAQNWDHGRQYVEMAAAIVVSIWVGYEVAGWVDGMLTSSAAAIGDAAMDAALASGVSGMAAEEAGSFAMTQALAGSGIISGIAGGTAGGFVAGSAMAAMAGQNGGQILNAGLKGAAAGLIMGGIAGYYGGDWTRPLQRIGVTSAGGGMASEVSGGRFRDGAIIAGAQALMAWGWEKARAFTDENGRRAAQSWPNKADQLLSEDSFGHLQTAGIVPSENGLPFAPDWLDRLASPINRFYDWISMKGQGSGMNWFEKDWVGGIDGPVNQVFQAVSKIHDWMNGALAAGYNPETGLFVSRGNFYDAMFSTGSWLGMPPAAAYTATALAPTAPLIVVRRVGGDGQ